MWAASMRKPSTSCSSQKCRTSNIAACTSGLRQLRSGCLLSNECRYYCPVAASHSQADPPKWLTQLLGGVPPGLASAQIYQCRRDASLEERDSRNQGCSSELWLITKSMMTLIPYRCACCISSSNVARSPKIASTSV